MIDFILGLYLVGLLVRGWLRGFVRELMDLVGMVVGLFAAFHLSGPAGEVVSAWSGLGPGPARLAGGLAVFLVVGVGAAVGAHFLGRAVSLGGLRMINRVLGSILALLWGLLLATFLLSLTALLPVDSVEERLDESVLASGLLDPKGAAQQVFQALSGDRVLESVLNLEELVGDRRVVLEEGEVLELTAAAVEDLADDAAAAQRIFDLLNRARVDVGVSPLAWSDSLAAVGLEHATEMYTLGYFAHESSETGTVADRVAAAGISFRLVGENLALAVTPELVHEGLIDSEGHRANILRAEFRRVGIGVVSGPLGLMVVQVFAG